MERGILTKSPARAARAGAIFRTVPLADLAALLVNKPGRERRPL